MRIPYFCANLREPELICESAGRVSVDPHNPQADLSSPTIITLGVRLWANRNFSTQSFHGIIIDHAVGAPGHGKDEVDSLNPVDKRFFLEKMVLIITPPRQTRAQIECMLWPELMVQAWGRRSEEWREILQTWRIFKYEKMCLPNATSLNLSMVCKLWYKTKESQGQSLKSMYNFRVHLKLGLGWIVIQRMPCGCTACWM
jgi:hypothetical protein